MTDQPIPEESLDGIEMTGYSPPAEEPKAEAPKEEPLELGGEEAPEATPEDVEDEKKKTRSQRWEKRVDNLTARLREAERRAAEAEARTVPAQDNTPLAPDAYAKNPDGSDKYEFGEADPQYIKDAALFEVRKELAEERKREKETSDKNAEKEALSRRVNEGMGAAERQGSESYDDFEDVVSSAIEERGGEPLNPIVSIALAVSPVGGHLTYALAKDPAASAKLERLAEQSPQQAALAFGELEGQHLDVDYDDSDLDLRDPMDVLRLNGRMKARLSGKRAGQVERKKSKAPEPQEKQARGASGRYEADWSAENADLNELGKLLR